ncbi:AMP-binding protein [Spirilliplanes yamanashiensis]|uniref:AMP-binding protein n=1 Tax=Spirilliplanes yamanashiensis TaxID=42233 RepID=UPI001952621C|nr:AMP-binding protein [Spirilliplanes yamanashiensis]MDP9819488.1 acyl-CoA synthetase (AMP-forming)/AMP-acid ligase II [Spirilliplanes yamanashiensis]
MTGTDMLTALLTDPFDDPFAEPVLPEPGASLVDGRTGGVLGGAHLAAAVTAAAGVLASAQPGLVLALAPRTVSTVLAWLGAVQARRPIALIDPALGPEALDELVRRYRPAAVLGVAGRPEPLPPPGYAAAAWPLLGDVWTGPGATGAHPELCLLLATSARTGSPTLVRHSRAGVLAQAAAVAAAAGIGPAGATATTMPLHHASGLAMVNAHLALGGRVTLGAGPATTLALTPGAVRELDGFPGTVLQAGGRMRPADALAARAGRLLLSYGQAEAGRMAVLPAELLAERAGAAGLPVRGGRFGVRDLDLGRPLATGVTGELVFAGPGVMMGYASGAHDLVRGDDLGGDLPTGDLGHVDADGVVTVTGRIRRTGTVLGTRISLDDVEQMLRHRGPVAAVDGDDRLVVWTEQATAEQRADIRAELAGRTGLDGAGIDVRDLPALPLLASGSVDYGRLRELSTT